MTTWSDVVDPEKDFRGGEPEESEEDARARMLPDELAQDDEYRQLALRRSQPLKVNGSKGQWGTWRKRKAGSVARRARAGG